MDALGAISGGFPTQPDVVRAQLHVACAGRSGAFPGCAGLSEPMGSRSRIRWENVAKLGAGGAACVALVAALPGLLRRPEPPPLEPDVGFSSAASGPTPSTDHLARHRSHVAADARHDKSNRRHHPRERIRRHPSSKADKPEGGGSPSPASPPTPGPTQTIEVAPTPTNSPGPVAPPQPPAPPPAPAPPRPDSPEPSFRPSEFGFER